MKKNVRILLVNPPASDIYGPMRSPVQLHMGLAYLAAMLLQEEVRVVDMEAQRLTLDDFVALIRAERFDLFGCTVTTPLLFTAFDLAAAVKRYSPQTRVVFGGTHPTILPREVLRNPAVDMVVRGEGEETLRELVDCLKAGGSYAGVRGLSYKDETGGIVENEARPLLTDLDRLPFPARHLFSVTHYTYPDALYRRTAPIMTSRGCPGRCSYCMSHRVCGRVFRAHSALRVADEIEQLVRRYGIREIHVWDDNFTTDRQRVFAIRDEIQRRKLKVCFAFPNGIRADFLSREVLTALKEMGTYSLAIGVESGSQEVLDAAHKGTHIARLKEVFALARELRLELWGFFMIGLPAETPDSIRQTISFAQELDPDIAKFHILKPYPGSEVYDFLLSKDAILTRDYRRFGIHTPPIHRLPGLTPEELLAWQHRAYRSFYLRPSKIVREFLRMRSLNRFRLNMQAAWGLAKMLLRGR